MTTHGPYDTREQARAAAAPLYAAINAADPGGPMTEQIRARRHAAVTTLIDNALHAVGVEFGAYETDIIDWLANWELETVQVVLAWPQRARDAAEVGLRGEIDTLRAQVESLERKIRRAPTPALPEGARVSTRHGIGTIINPANLYEPGAVVELDDVLRDATVRHVVEPVDDMVQLDGSHTRNGEAP